MPCRMQALARLDAVLQHAGLDKRRLLSVRIVYTRRSTDQHVVREALTDEWNAYVDPGAAPAVSLLPMEGFVAAGGALVGIEATAAL